MHLSDTSAWYETKPEYKPNPLDSSKSFVVLTKSKDMFWLAEIWDHFRSFLEESQLRESLQG